MGEQESKREIGFVTWDTCEVIEDGHIKSWRNEGSVSRPFVFEPSPYQSAWQAMAIQLLEAWRIISTDSRETVCSVYPALAPIYAAAT